MYTYLVIDDEELTRKGTIKKLSPMAETITCIGEAENGEIGIQKIEALHPDIVVLDMQMPIMDGTKLLPYLSEHYPDMPLIVISGYRDFDYIKTAISANAIDYVVKPFSREAIQTCMQQAIDRLDDNTALHSQIMNNEEEKEMARYQYDLQMLSNLIQGFHQSEVAITSKKLNFINNTHNLILFTLHFRQSDSNASVQDWLDENGFGDLALYLVCNNNPQMGFLILFMPEKTSITNKHLTQQILDSILPWLEQQSRSVIIGISDVHSTLMQLNTAFQETAAALNQQKLEHPTSSYYFYDKDEKTLLLDWEKQEEFLFRIETGNLDEVTTLTNELFDYALQTPGCTMASVKYYCYQISDQCRILLNDYLNQPEKASSSSSMQNVVNNIFVLDELNQYYLQFFRNIAVLLENQNVYVGDDVIEQIQTYIRRNYQKHLTQDFISCLFYLNRSYLSTLFKAQTGEKFVDFLNDVRIEKSKELLKDSNRKMYQVAKSVGYDNVKYFFRIFKKKVGMTPEQYRSQS